MLKSEPNLNPPEVEEVECDNCEGYGEVLVFGYYKTCPICSGDSLEEE